MKRKPREVHISFPCHESNFRLCRSMCGSAMRFRSPYKRSPGSAQRGGIAPSRIGLNRKATGLPHIKRRSRIVRTLAGCLITNGCEIKRGLRNVDNQPVFD
jgi:hypothetical protein